MVDKRNAPQAGSRYMLTGLWGGIAIGRVALAFLAKRLGERTFSISMLVAASVFLGVVWAVRNVTVDALSLVLVGFFIGLVFVLNFLNVSFLSALEFRLIFDLIFLLSSRSIKLNL